MSIHFSQGKLQGEERKSILQEVQTQAKAAALRAIKPVLSGFLEEELTAKLGRGKREPRRVSGQARLIDWQCGSCGCSDGHYRRNLETGWGELEDLQVPMLECQECLHDVVAYWTIVEKFKRFWLDLDQDVLFGSGLCQSLRESPRTVECHAGQQCGLADNQRTHQSDRASPGASPSRTDHRCAHSHPIRWP